MENEKIAKELVVLAKELMADWPDMHFDFYNNTKDIAFVGNDIEKRGEAVYKILQSKRSRTRMDKKQVLAWLNTIREKASSLSVMAKNIDDFADDIIHNIEDYKFED